MSEKKIDKDNLINQLFDYISQEIHELSEKKEILTKSYRNLDNEKKERIKHQSSQSQVYQIRKVFSPLAFNIDEVQHIEVDTSDLDKDMNQQKIKLNRIETKIGRLSEYLESLEENYFIADNKINDSNEKIQFLPAFYQLLEHIKRIHPKVKIYYESVQKQTNVLLNLSFLKGFDILMKCLILETGVYVINLDEYIDKYKVLLQFQIKPKIPSDVVKFKERKLQLEHELTKEFSIIRWKTNSIIIQALLEL